MPGSSDPIAGVGQGQQQRPGALRADRPKSLVRGFCAPYTLVVRRPRAERPDGPTKTTRGLFPPHADLLDVPDPIAALGGGSG